MDSPQSLSNDVEGLSVPLDSDQVRLLKIVPGADDEPVSCLLQTLSIGSCPAYTALSYCCGNPSITEEIWIDKAERRVTTYLESFLRHARLEGWTGVFWIDALCINPNASNEGNIRKRCHHHGLGWPCC